jgi:hypothetical protein
LASTITALALSGGFVEAIDNEVRVLADVAELRDGIDADRARRSRSRAKERIESRDPEIDYDRARRALDRAEARLSVTSDPRTLIGSLPRTRTPTMTLRVASVHLPTKLARLQKAASRARYAGA